MSRILNTSTNIAKKEKLILSAAAGAALSFNFIFFGMLHIYAANRIGLYPTLSEVFTAALAMFIPCAIVLTGLLFITPGRLFPLAVSLAAGLLIAGYAQSNIMNNLVDLGPLTGTPITWENYSTFTIITSIVWLLLIILPVIVRDLFSPIIWKRALLIICALLSLMQGTALVAVIITNREELRYVPRNYLSREGAYEVSSVSNILVFVIDCLDYRFIDEIYRTDPEFFDRLDGFTEFTNTAASYAKTFPSAVHLTTGIPYNYEQRRVEYFDYAWNNSPFIETLKDADFIMKYHMGGGGHIYTSFDQIAYAADNIKDGRAKPVFSSVVRNLLQLTAYRFAPMAFKMHFRMSSVTFETTGNIPETERVSSNDPLFMRLLTDNGLSLQNERGNYFYLHLNGAHTDYTMDENGMYVGQSDVISQTKGSFAILYRYMDEMKRLGVYEDATIVIIGDHAANGFHIGCFIKPRGASGTPLERSNAPISLGEHIIPAILDSEGFNYSMAGIPAFDVAPDTPGQRYAIRQAADRQSLDFLKITGHVRDEDSYEVLETRPVRTTVSGLPIE